MTEQEQYRFDMLRQGPCVPPEYVAGYYGLPWPLPDDARQDYDAWLSRLRRRHNCIEGWISRYELESFMQQKGVVPKKWMGARLGMRIASLDELLARLRDIGIRPERYVVYTDLISKSLSEDIVLNLPGLKFRTFSDHNNFCSRLHAELAKVLGIQVAPLFCETSDRIQDYPRQFASNFDCITLAPLSVKHQVWLDFRKPLNLGPDRCSKLLYIENRDVLRPVCAGTQEPDDLEQYASFLAKEQHA
jgi:hypothetical protein